MRNNIPEGCFVVGNKLMGKCFDCGKIIRIDKPVLGSMHLCVLPEEIETSNNAERWVDEVKAKYKS